MSTTTDVELIEQTLELLAEAIEDITPLVYENFFTLRPEASELWDLESKMNQGHMLNEIFTCLLEQAAGKSFLGDIYEAHVTDHLGMGVADTSLFRDFLHALQATIAEVLGDHWPRDAKAAFQHHCDLMKDHLVEAEQVLADRGLMSLPGLKLRNFAKK